MRKYMHEIVVERCANVATAILRREHEPGKVQEYLVIIPTISENEQKISYSDYLWKISKIMQTVGNPTRGGV